MSFFEIGHDALHQPLTSVDLDESDVVEAISTLSSATGPDDLQATLLKSCANELARPLCLFFRQGSIPPPLKLAADVPIFKGGDRTLPGSFRPISLMSILLKVLEKIVKRQVVSFLTASSLLNPTQHGFREGRSCLSALLEVYDNILAYQSEGSTNVDMIYLDFTKAFDKGDHGVFCHKLRHLGISGELGVWFYHFHNFPFLQ